MGTLAQQELRPSVIDLLVKIAKSEYFSNKKHRAQRFCHVTLNRRIFRVGLIPPLFQKSDSATDLKERTELCGKLICRPLELIFKDV